MDGRIQATHDNQGDWGWQQLDMTVAVEQPGNRMLRLWVREDNVRVDKLVLTTDADWQPSGAGPEESERRPLD